MYVLQQHGPGRQHLLNGGYGGAIQNYEGVNMTILDCSFTGNQANSGGGPDAVGGALDDERPR